MKTSTLKYGIITLALSLISLILVLMPFHAFLTVWGASLFGHYTLLRLWKEILLLPIGLSVLFLIIFDNKVRFSTLRRKLTWLIVAFLGLQLLDTWLALAADRVSLKAAAYGLLLDCRYLVFFLLCWAVAVRTPRFESRWPKLLLWPAVAVVAFGILEVTVLPSDFLKHFGYGPNTIPAVSTINHNAHYLRFMSTLRGANPLGAYLLLPISALVVLLLRYPKSWNWVKGLLLAGSLFMLYFSFSRSSWIGAALSVMAAFAVVRLRLSRAWAGGLALVGALLVVAAGALVLQLRHSADLQNYLLHTQTHSAVKATSDQGHLAALRGGVHDVVHQPLGQGPGTAGPASYYNAKAPARIAENYYLQIGQETGLPGLFLYLAILGVVAYLLWTRRSAALAAALLCSLIGLSFIALLSHVWTDDTLAYVWWGLAGLAIGTPAPLKLEPAEEHFAAGKKGQAGAKTKH